MFSIGIDVADPIRLEKRLKKRPELADELFTPAELTYCRSRYEPLQSLSGRFAVKEAVVKALALDGWDPLEIETLEGHPAPRLLLHGSVGEIARERQVTVQISIAHLPQVAVAVAIVVPASLVSVAQSL